VTRPTVLLQLASAKRSSLPCADPRSRLRLFGPGMFFRQNAICHLDISQSHKNLSVGVIR
jgi:hypothetical protein